MTAHVGKEERGREREKESEGAFKRENQWTGLILSRGGGKPPE